MGLHVIQFCKGLRISAYPSLFPYPHRILKKLHLYQVVLSLLSVAAWLKLNVAAISCALIMSDFVRTRQECRDVTSFTGADDLTRSSYVRDTEVQRHINHHSPVIWNNRVPWHNMHPAICAQMERERCLLHPHAWPRVIDHNHDMAACRWPLSCAIRRRSYSRDETRDAIRIHTKNEIHENPLLIATESSNCQMGHSFFCLCPIWFITPFPQLRCSASLMADLIWSFRDLPVVRLSNGFPPKCCLCAEVATWHRRLRCL